MYSCKTLLSSLYTLLVVCFLAPFASAVVFVDGTKPAGGNGSSWASAFQSIEAAVSGSGEGQEFWIAAGVYTPLDSIIPKANSSFYGGFSGNESSRGQRDAARHSTVVDGLGKLSHIFTVMNHGVRFDGLQIRNGNASGARGGGLLVNRASAIIVNCTFTGNTALSGGAIYAFDADITISKSRFQNNSASGTLEIDGRGGAVWTHLQTPIISDSTFTNNSAFRLGGAVEINNAPSAEIYNCSFTGNKLTNNQGVGGGGAVSLQLAKAFAPSSSAAVSKSRFEGNSSQLEGGAIYSNEVHLVVSESEFVGNTAKNGGAVMVDYKTGQPSRIERCVFLENKAQHTTAPLDEPPTSGAVHSYMRSIVIENSIFANNTSQKSAGAAGFNAGTGESAYDPNMTTIIRNSTFFQNTAVNLGGGLCNWGVQGFQVYNSIFWNNEDGQSGDNLTDDLWAYEASINVYYSDLESLDEVRLGVNLGNFSADPQFVNPSADDFRLGDGSPCIDSANGNHLSQPSYDLYCNDRFDYSGIRNAQGSPADIGALEKVQATDSTSSCPSAAPVIPQPAVSPPPSHGSSSPLMHVYQILLR